MARFARASAAAMNLAAHTPVAGAPVAPRCAVRTRVPSGALRPANAAFGRRATVTLRQLETARSEMDALRIRRRGRPATALAQRLLYTPSAMFNAIPPPKASAQVAPGMDFFAAAMQLLAVSFQEGGR